MKTIVTLSSKGQFTVPASIRSALGFEKGDRLEVTVDESRKSMSIRPLVGIEELSTRVSAYAREREPVVDVDAYYQQHRSE